MGYEYYYLEEGNDVEKLIDLFKTVKNTNKPTVVHIHTLKGKGYEPAVTDKESYHWQLPNFMNNKDKKQTPVETYTSITNDYLIEKAKKDDTLMVVSPATPGATGLTPDVRAKLGKHYTDVAIAEQHAVGYISGLAYNGAKPVLEVLSSFIQRSYDQISQDMAINNAPATILVFWGEISPADVTHLQVFDIPLISNIPNIVYLAPTNKEEYLAMLDWSVEQTKYPVVIRVPMTNLVSTGVADNTDYAELNKFKIASKGEKVAIIGVGSFYQLAEQVKSKLKAEQNIDATLINPVYLTGLDENALEDLKANHELVITLEDGVLDGGYGEKVARYYGNSDMKVLNFGAKKEFTDRTPMDELNKRYHLTTELIVKDIENLLKTVK